MAVQPERGPAEQPNPAIPSGRVGARSFKFLLDARSMLPFNGAAVDRPTFIPPPPSSEVFGPPEGNQPEDIGTPLNVGVATEQPTEFQSKDIYEAPQFVPPTETSTSAEVEKPERKWLRKLIPPLPVFSRSPEIEEYSPYHQDSDLKLGKVKGPVTNLHRNIERLPKLVERKLKSGEEVHLIFPTLNEGPRNVTDPETGETVVRANIADTIREMLPLVEAGLVNDLTVIDSGSTDKTRECVEALMREHNTEDKEVIKFIDARSALDELGVRYRRNNVGVRVLEKLKLKKRTEIVGKGANLWLAAMKYKGILGFVDSDMGARASQIHGHLSALLTNKKAQVSLSILRRYTQQGHPDAKPAQGGRVTRIAAHPGFENVFGPKVNGYPEILGSIYFARSGFLQEIEFPAKYGVETAIVATALQSDNDQAVVQVFCGEKRQVGQNAEALGSMSSQIFHELLTQGDKHGRLRMLRPYRKEIFHGHHDVTPTNDIIVEVQKIAVDHLPAPAAIRNSRRYKHKMAA